MLYLSSKPGEKLSVKDRIAALTMFSLIHLNCEEKSLTLSKEKLLSPKQIDKNLTSYSAKEITYYLLKNSG